MIEQGKDWSQNEDDDFIDSQTIMNISLNSTQKVKNKIIDFSSEKWGKDESDL